MIYTFSLNFQQVKISEVYKKGLPENGKNINKDSEWVLSQYKLSKL
ncbi:hypothetical protein THOG11_20024 [Vibrio harveyi]|nr:hypothetical protein TH15OA1_530371 [Vibrio harveyi]CAH1554364.1 hypothetical protein THOD03_20024 [Vibrio harveyi]CAH1561088.1 hypothetical protein THOG11_20024 [Vibrio harveyi]